MGDDRTIPPDASAIVVDNEGRWFVGPQDGKVDQWHLFLAALFRWMQEDVTGLMEATKAWSEQNPAADESADKPST